MQGKYVVVVVVVVVIKNRRMSLALFAPQLCNWYEWLLSISVLLNAFNSSFRS